MGLTKISTDGVKDDAVTTDKLANAINTERTANTAKVQTTINNNADNRVITGSGTANTLEGEANLTFDGQTLKVDNTSANPQFHLTSAANGLCELKFGDANDTTRGNIIYRNGTAGDALCFNGYNNTERMRIDSSGNVGVGTSTPTASNAAYNGALLHLHQTNGTSAGSQVHLTTGASGQGVGDGSILAQWSDNNLYINNQESGNIQFYTGGASRARLDSDGLKFGSDTAAANALDDYEEGTFTPRYQTSNGNWGGSMSNQSGSYTKIGNVVHVRFALQWGSVSGSGNFRITALPFTVANTASNEGGGATIGARSGFNYARLTSYFMLNNQQLQFQYVDSSGSNGSFDLSVGALASTGHVYCSGWYETA